MPATPNSTFSQTPLHLAAEKGDTQECQNLIAAGADVNALDEYGSSPLVLAVQGNHTEAARLLLKSGADMHYVHQREDTPEARAKQITEIEAINKMAGLEESMAESFKDLPEDLREEMTNQDAIMGMLEDMVDLHFEPNHEHALDYCLSLPVLKLLITEFKADINHISEEDYWPLSSFAETNNSGAVKWLLENGANPNHTSTGETAIFKAIRNDNLEIVQLFVSHGARLDSEDVDGWSVLFPCKSSPMAKYLIEKGADPTALDQCGFPCWNWIDNQETQDFLKKEALARGLKKWTSIEE